MRLKRSNIRRVRRLFDAHTPARFPGELEVSSCYDAFVLKREMAGRSSVDFSQRSDSTEGYSPRKTSTRILSLINKLGMDKE